MSSDPQDPLPEASWKWRRGFIWLLTCAAGWEVHLIALRISDPAALRQVVGWLIALIALLATYYLIAPSAEHIVRVVQAAKVRLASTVERAAEMIGRRGADDPEGGS